MDTRQSVSDLRYALSDTEVDAYHRDGIIGPFALMTPEEMEKERLLINREIIKPAENDESSPELRRHNRELRYHDRHLDLESVCRICRPPELVERVASLLGPDVLIWRSNFQVKHPAAAAVGEAKSHTSVPWHQDGAYFDLQPLVLVSAWIAITEATEENGCLKIVAGSHRQTFDHDVEQDRHEFERSIPDEAIDQDAVRSLALRPGEYVLFNENTVHASEPNMTPHARIGLTPRLSVPFVKVTGNPRYAGLDRERHAPDELRQVAMLRGHDYTGRHRVVSLPCGER